MMVMRNIIASRNELLVLLGCYIDLMGTLLSVVTSTTTGRHRFPPDIAGQSCKEQQLEGLVGILAQRRW